MPTRAPLPWKSQTYWDEFRECQWAFDEAYPGERAAHPDHLILCPHWNEFRSAWLGSHPFEIEGSV